MSYKARTEIRKISTDDVDPRWATLNKVQAAREALGLKDRDLSVLRGLLSLITAEAWTSGGAVMVYASNKVLSERCNGIEERTLRRRLQHLADVGLITRHLSPNRKRYSLRDASGVIVLSYGFDLAPLRAALPRIESLAEETAERKLQLRNLRALLRDRLWQLAQAGTPPAPEHQRLLRNKAEPEDLELVLQSLPELASPQTDKMSDSDSEIVRDIQSSNKEHIDKKETGLHLSEVIEHAQTALEWSPEPIQSWHDLCNFTQAIAPALAIKPTLLRQCQEALGPEGTSVTILGILQAGTKINRPSAYLAKLVSKANLGLLNIRRMFFSITAAQGC